jgi:hypothetical protein
MEASVETAQVIPAEQVIAACLHEPLALDHSSPLAFAAGRAVPGSARIADMA